MGTGIYQKVGSIETGNLNEYFPDGFMMPETTGNPQDIGQELLVEPSKRPLKFYLLTTYMDDEVVLAHGKRPVRQPEAEIILMTDSEMLLQTAMQIMEGGLSRFVTKLPIKRLDAELYADGHYKITVDDSLMVGDRMVPITARFG